MSDYTPAIVRELLDGWQDLQANRWPEATLLRRKLQGGNSPAHTEDGGRDLAIARTRTDLITAWRYLAEPQQMVVQAGVFENQAPLIEYGKTAQRDWSAVAQHIGMRPWEVGQIYRDATRNMAYHLGWRPRVIRQTRNVEIPI